MADTLPPVDQATPVPPSVAKAAAAAEALHKQIYPDSAPAPEPAPPAETPPDTLTAPDGQPPETPEAPVPPPVQTQPPAAPQDQAPQAQDNTPTKKDNLPEGEWKNHYLSMKGRFEQAQKTIGGMQEQMQELGDELVRTQRAVRQPQQRTQPPQRQQTQPPQRLVTEKDVELYGEDMLDTVTRAARQAVQGDLQQAQEEIRRVNQQLARQTNQSLAQTLTAQVPDWREINKSPRFKQWCSLRDVYSGAVRSDLLNAAIKAADAPRAIAFFRGFLQEEQATGHVQPEAPEVPGNPPRSAALPLEALAAPGRAKPATGNSATPVDKPVFTRAQISGFYSAVRKGAYAGRDAEKARDEAAIFSAQSEGRVRG